jgi:hypothetical protein
MNHNHNYIPIPPPIFRVPANADQIRVSARHLHSYIIDASLYLGDWVDSLRHMADEPNNSMMGWRVFYDGMKGVDSTLNLNLAMFLIIRSSHCATGAVARVILAEGLLSASNGHIDDINQRLANYECLANRYSGYIYPLALHYFLRVDAPFEYWFDCQKKNLRLRCGRGYFRFLGSRRYSKENGPGQFYFDEFTAGRVIKATRTNRGEWASFYLRNPSSELVEP